MLPLLALCVGAVSQGHCLRFEGDGQIAVVPYQKMMDVRELTLEVWIKVDDSSKERYFNYIVCRNYGDLGYGLALHGSPTKVFSQADSVAVPIGKWTHIALVASNKAQKFYLNGELAAAWERLGELKPFARNLDIGNSDFLGIPGDQPTSFRGLIDEVRIWSKPMTQQQVRSKMNAYLRGSEKNLIGYFPFEEGKGQFIHDYSGHLISGSLGRSFQPGGDDPTWAEGVTLSGRKPTVRRRQ